MCESSEINIIPIPIQIMGIRNVAVGNFIFYSTSNIYKIVIEAIYYFEWTSY